MMKNQKRFSVVEVLLALLVLGMIIGTGWYVFQGKNKSTDVSSNYNPKQDSENINQPISETEIAKPCTTVSSESKYNNEELDISFKYPSGWKQSDKGYGDAICSLGLQSPEFKSEQEDNGYRIVAGAEITFFVETLDSYEASEENMQKSLGKTTIDSSADFINFVKGLDGGWYINYDSPEVLDGIVAGRGSCGHYSSGPCVYWSYNDRVYFVDYDANSDIYTAEYESLLKSIVLD